MATLYQLDIHCSTGDGPCLEQHDSERVYVPAGGAVTVFVGVDGMLTWSTFNRAANGRDWEPVEESEDAAAAVREEQQRAALRRDIAAQREQGPGACPDCGTARYNDWLTGEPACSRCRAGDGAA